MQLSSGCNGDGGGYIPYIFVEPDESNTEEAADGVRQDSEEGV